MHGAGLPIVVTDSFRKDSVEVRACSSGDQQEGEEGGEKDRAPFRSFTSRELGPPPSSQHEEEGEPWLPPGQTQHKIKDEERNFVRSNSCDVGKRTFASEEEGEVGYWIGGGEAHAVLNDGGVAEQKCGLISPPPSWRKASV